MLVIVLVIVIGVLVKGVLVEILTEVESADTEVGSVATLSQVFLIRCSTPAFFLYVAFVCLYQFEFPL